MITTTKLIEEGVIWNTIKNLGPAALMAGGSAALGLSRLAVTPSDEFIHHREVNGPTVMSAPPSPDGNYYYTKTGDSLSNWIKNDSILKDTEIGNKIGNAAGDLLKNSTVSGKTVGNMTMGGLTALGVGGILSAANNIGNQTKRVVGQNQQIRAYNNMQKQMQPQQAIQPQHTPIQPQMNQTSLQKKIN